MLFGAHELSEEQIRKTGKPVLLNSLGTGFFIDTEAHVITANHVVEEAVRRINEISAGIREILVGVRIQATGQQRDNFAVSGVDIIAKDVLHDLCLLKLKKNPFSGELTSKFTMDGKELPLSCAPVTLNPVFPREGEKIGIYPVILTRINQR
ncbi:hypothetical protein ES703_100446 [subsurface metagenome]